MTPFSARARDRSLAAALVGLCRHSIPELTSPDGSMRFAAVRNSSAVQDAIRVLVDRAGRHRHCNGVEEEHLKEEVRREITRLLESWVRLADDARQVGGTLYYQKAETDRPRSVMIHEWLETDLEQKYRPFRMTRSMRDVEPGVELDIQRAHL